MSRSIDSALEARILELADQKVRELLRGDVMQTEVRPRGVPVDRLALASGSPVSSVAGQVAVWDGKRAIWLPPGADGSALIADISQPGGVKWRPRSFVSVYKSAAQSLPNATLTLVSFDAEAGDTNSMHDNATNNSRVYAQVAGVHQINANIVMDNNGGTSVQGELRLNAAGNPVGGSLVQSRAGTTAVGNSFRRHIPFNVAVYLAAGDYVEAFAYQNSGASVALVTATGWTTVDMTCIG